MREFTEEQKTEAADLFAGGASINLVAKTLGISWYEAKQLQPASETEPEAAEDAEWDLTIRIPKVRVPDIFAAFTAQEQADAVAYVLQQRMDLILESASEA